MVESRKDERAVVSLIARYRSPTVFEFVEEECYDLSRGGMFIKSPNPAPAGTLLKLECQVGKGASAIRGIARVVWVRELEQENAPRGMGVKFIKLEPGSPELIEGILDKVGSLEESAAAQQVAEIEPAEPAPESKPEPEPAVEAKKDEAESEPEPPPEAAENKPEPEPERPQEENAKEPVPEAEPPAQAAETLPDTEPRTEAAEQARPEQLEKEEEKTPEPSAEEKAAVAAEPPAESPAEEPQKDDEEPKSTAEETPEQESRDRIAELAKEQLDPVRDRTTLPVPGARDERSSVSGWLIGLTAAGLLLLIAASLGFFGRSEPETEAGAEPATDEQPSQPEQQQPAEPAAQTEAQSAIPPETGEAATEPEQTEPVVEEQAPEPEPPPVAEPEPEPKRRPRKARRPRKPRTRSTTAVAEKPAEPAPAATPEPVPAATPEPEPAPIPEPEPVVDAPAEEKPVQKTPFEAATECIAQGDNQCVIKALAGRARTEREYRLLIETYRAVGNSQAAIEQMAKYVEKFPSGGRAGSYRKMLERNQL